MSTARQRRGLQGVTPLRRKLRRMEKVVESGIRPAMIEISEAIATDAQQLVPKDTGDLAASIGYKVSSDGMASVIGPGAGSAVVVRSIRQQGYKMQGKRSQTALSTASKELLMQFFKGVWSEFGTKGTPKKGIPPLPARPFMHPAFDMNKAWGVAKIRLLVNAQLERIAEYE